jgi:hypothetical protein
MDKKRITKKQYLIYLADLTSDAARQLRRLPGNFRFNSCSFLHTAGCGDRVRWPAWSVRIKSAEGILDDDDVRGTDGLPCPDRNHWNSVGDGARPVGLLQFKNELRLMMALRGVVYIVDTSVNDGYEQFWSSQVSPFDADSPVLRGIHLRLAEAHAVTHRRVAVVWKDNNFHASQTVNHGLLRKFVAEFLLPLKGLIEHFLCIVGKEHLHRTKYAGSDRMADVLDTWGDVQLHSAILESDTWRLNGKRDLQPWSFGQLKLSFCRFRSSLGSLRRLFSGAALVDSYNEQSDVDKKQRQTTDKGTYLQLLFPWWGCIFAPIGACVLSWGRWDLRDSRRALWSGLDFDAGAIVYVHGFAICLIDLSRLL